MTDTQHSTRVTLSNEAYDVLKFIAQILLPALGTLYFALAAIWEFPNPAQVIGTITAVDVFLGILLGLSTSGYKAGTSAAVATPEEEPVEHDGTLTVNGTDPNKDSYSIEVNKPFDELAKKDTITLKVNSPSE